jgi:hypothetical protein
MCDTASMQKTKARETGTYVYLMEGDDLPWMLVCDAHDMCCEFDTKAQAIDFRSAPTQWCEDCANGVAS